MALRGGRGEGDPRAFESGSISLIQRTRTRDLRHDTSTTETSLFPSSAQPTSNAPKMRLKRRKSAFRTVIVATSRGRIDPLRWRTPWNHPIDRNNPSSTRSLAVLSATNQGSIRLFRCRVPVGPAIGRRPPRGGYLPYGVVARRDAPARRVATPCRPWPQRQD